MLHIKLEEILAVTVLNVTDPLVFRIEALLSFVFFVVVTVLYLRTGNTSAKSAKKVTPKRGKKNQRKA